MKFDQGSRKRSLALAAAVACGLASAAAFAAVPQFVTLAQSTHLGIANRVQGAVPLSTNVHITVSLKLRNEAALQAYNAKPHAPLSAAELAANYLPTQAQANQVVAYLRAHGYRNITVSSNRMLVRAVGPASAAHAAFRTSLAHVRTRDGRLAIANTSPIAIPASLAGIVSAVTGLQTVHRAHTLAVRTRATTGVLGGHYPTGLASIYGATGLAPAGNVAVAVMGWGNMAQSVADLNTYATGNSLSIGAVNTVCVDVGGTQGNNTMGDATCGGNTDSSGVIEWNLDSQDMLAMAGGLGSLTFYSADTASNADLTDTLNEIVTPTLGEPLPQAVNMSFGECERWTDAGQNGDGSAQQWDALFQVGISQGVTFSASTGDSGFDECGDGQMDSASQPASSPYVVAVSGTLLRATATTFSRESVWSDAGGSPSSFEVAQPWQTSLTYGPYAGMRGPDVAFDAAPASGVAIIMNGSTICCVGGTSLSSPLFVGAWARILQAHPGLGFAAPVLYGLPASVFHDVTAGNNRGSDPVGGYSAKIGWDWATGLGSFDVGQASAVIPSSPTPAVVVNQ